MNNRALIITTTFADNPQGCEISKKIAQELISQKLAFCTQISKIESFYNYNDKFNNDKEISLKIKTFPILAKKVQNLIKKHHNYDNFELISYKITILSKDYLSFANLILKKSLAI